MSSENLWPEPQWLVDAPDSERATLCFQYYLRLACVYASPEGNLTALADRMGVTSNVLSLARHRGRCSHDIAIRIEKLLGVELFPRELFRPEPELPLEG